MELTTERRAICWKIQRKKIYGLLHEETVVSSVESEAVCRLSPGTYTAYLAYPAVSEGQQIDIGRLDVYLCGLRKSQCQLHLPNAVSTIFKISAEKWRFH